MYKTGLPFAFLVILSRTEFICDGLIYKCVEGVGMCNSVVMLVVSILDCHLTVGGSNPAMGEQDILKFLSVASHSELG